MLRHAVALLLAGLIISGGSNRLTGAPPDDRSGKWRILVDKVVSHETRPNITNDQVREIAEAKMKDLNAADVEGAMAMVEGSARSMGLEVRG